MHVGNKDDTQQIHSQNNEESRTDHKVGLMCY